MTAIIPSNFCERFKSAFLVLLLSSFLISEVAGAADSQISEYWNKACIPKPRAVCIAEYKQCLAILTRQDNGILDNEVVMQSIPPEFFSNVATQNSGTVKLAGKEAAQKFPSEWRVTYSNGDKVTLTPTSDHLKGLVELSRSATKKSCSAKFSSCVRCQ